MWGVVSRWKKALNEKKYPKRLQIQKIVVPLHRFWKQALLDKSFGEMAEWSIAAVLKTVVLRGTGGSNPSLSAINAENQQIIKQTPNFTPKNVKLGVFILYKKYKFNITNTNFPNNILKYIKYRHYCNNR